MLGIAERGRLMMYEKTLVQTLEDTRDGTFFHKMALTTVLTWFFQTTGAAMRGSLRETIEAIPSARLSDIDFCLLRSIAAPSSMDAMPIYQAATALNGLVFVRIVEVARPRLSQRAWRLREGLLDFYEPAYAMFIEMLNRAAVRGGADARPSTRPTPEASSVQRSVPPPPAKPDSSSATAHTSASSAPVSDLAVVLVVAGVVAAATGVFVLSQNQHTARYSTQYVARPSLPSAPTADVPAPATVPKVEAPGRWITTTEMEDGTVPPAIYKREDVASLLFGQGCERAKQDSESFYSERIKAGILISMAMMEERAAVEFFACNPSATTYRSDQ